MNSKEEVISNYSNEIKRLKKRCMDAGMTNEEFRSIYFDALNNITKENELPRRKHFILRRKWLITTFILLLLIFYNLKSIYSNMQEYIYPSLQVLRRLSIPFISLFPSLTEYYHETCLVYNPFFTVVDMECWPCSSVNNIIEIDDPRAMQQQNAPYIYKTNQEPISMISIAKLYNSNLKVFESESPKVMVDSKNYISPKEMFDSLDNFADNRHYVWKLNTMNTGRLLRQIIPRPIVVPKYGQSTERFLIFDRSQKVLRLPDTECNFSFILVLNGSRTIQMKPADECMHQCRSLQIELKETYLLWYNWWYWKPRVLPSKNNETFIAHIGSYC